MSTQPNTAQALWDARDELQEFEQQTQEDGFTVVLAGGFIEVFDFGVDSITITAWQAGRKPPLNKTVVEVWDTVTAASAIAVVVHSDAAAIRLARTIKEATS